MDPIAIAPVAPPPVNETQPSREARDEDAAANRGFNETLEQEMAALKPDPAEAQDAAAGDAAAAAAGDAGSLPDAAGAADAAQLAVLATPMAQPAVTERTVPTGDALASRQDPAATAQATGAARPGELAAIRSSVLERARIEQRGVEQNTARQGLQRDSLRSGGAHGLQGTDPGADAAGSATDLAAETHLAAFTMERAVNADAAPTASHTASPLDSLSPSSLLARWSTGQSAASDVGPAPASARIETPLGASGWGEAFQQKIVWLVDRQQQSAELHVNPPHLGPVEIMLSMDDEGTRIAFCSPHAAVREAIEASLPDLRNALEERGLSLGEASVGADSNTAREQRAEEARNNSRSERAAPAALVADPVAQLPRRGLVDIFA